MSSSNIVGSESTGMSDLSDFVGRESTSSSTSIKQECLQDHIRCEASIIADGFTRSASSITEVTLIGSAFVAFWNRRCSSQVPETDKTGEYGADLLGSLGAVGRPSGRG